MTRHRVGAWPAASAGLVPAAGLVLAAGPVLAGGLVLAGCAASSGSSGPGRSPSADSSPAGLAGRGAGDSLFPDGTGNTWVYATRLGPAHGTSVSTITKVSRVSGGQRVTVTGSSDLAGSGGSAAPVIMTYVVHPDGSVTVPPPSITIAGRRVRLTSGRVTWPAPGGLSSGQPRRSTLGFRVRYASRVVTERARLTVRGSGTQSVTVPAGTYRAQVIDETVEERGPAAIDVRVRSWVVAGVGPVRSELVTGNGHAAVTGLVEELKSFTRGSMGQ